MPMFVICTWSMRWCSAMSSNHDVYLSCDTHPLINSDQNSLVWHMDNVFVGIIFHRHNHIWLELFFIVFSYLVGIIFHRYLSNLSRTISHRLLSNLIGIIFYRRLSNLAKIIFRQLFHQIVKVNQLFKSRKISTFK